MNDRRIQIGVIFGGRSGEHEVSLLSARSVLSVLSPDRYTVTEIGITHQGLWLSGEKVLEAFETGQTSRLFPVVLPPYPAGGALYHLYAGPEGERLVDYAHLDVVFPALHGSFGEDGSIQGLLELADLAYVGAGVLGSSVGMDKSLFKDVMRSHDIPVARSITANRREINSNMDEIITQAEGISNYPLFVKPVNMGSSVGISKCRNRSDLLEGLMDAARYDRRVLVEEFIDAREVEVSILGNDRPMASLPGEIIPSDDFYSYDAKYLDERSELIIPADLPEEQIRELQELAIRAYRAADCAGMARVDFLVERSTGKIFLSELNSIPGFTKISMYAKLWEASGLPYHKLVDRLIELAFERKEERDLTERQYRKGE